MNNTINFNAPIIINTTALTTAQQQQLITAHMALAKKVALTFSWSPMSDDDLVSEANLALCEAARHFNPANGAQFSTFAYTYIKGHLLNALQRYGYLPRRGQSSMPQFSTLDTDTEHEPAADGSFDTDYMATQADHQAASQHALAQLSPREGQVLQLHLDGLTAPQIAQQLGIATATAKSLKQSALAKYEHHVSQYLRD